MAVARLRRNAENFRIISHHLYYHVRSVKRQLWSVVPPTKSAQAISHRWCGAYSLCLLRWRYNRAKLYFYWTHMILSMIWNTSKLSSSCLSRATAIFVVDCCQFGRNCIFGLRMEFMACADLVGVTTEQTCLFAWPHMIVSMIWNTSKLSALHLSHATVIFVVDCCQLGLAGFLGWKWSLLPVPNWLAVQLIKDVFLLTLYDSINDMKHFWTACITPQPCNSHFCCWLLPIWP